MAGRSARGWHPEDIKAALKKRYGPVTRLSEAWGYHRSAISNAIAKPHQSTVLERRIAKALDVSPHTLWPDRWTPQGAPRPRSANARQPSRARTNPHRQKKGSA